MGMGKSPSNYVIRDADGSVVACLVHEPRSAEVFAVYAVDTHHNRQRLSDEATAQVNQAVRKARAKILDNKNHVLLVVIDEGEAFEDVSHRVRSAIATRLSTVPDLALFEAHDASSAMAHSSVVSTGGGSDNWR